MSPRKTWAAHFLAFELATAVAITAALIVWSEILSGSDHLNSFLHDHGETIYVVLAPITAAMLGFILAAAAIVVTAAPADRMTVLRESDHYADLWACFRSAMRFLGLATVAAIIGLAVSGEIASRVTFFVTAGLCVAAAFRVARCIWAVNWVIKIFTSPSLASMVEEREV
jgi:hypothetical protein